MNGMGHIANAMNANREFPHPRPSVAYMLCPTRGSSAPSRDRRTVLAARAEAAYIVNASTRYVCMGMKVASKPRPTRPVPMMGAIQKTCFSAVQPYMNTKMDFSRGELEIVLVLTANRYDE